MGFALQEAKIVLATLLRKFNFTVKPNLPPITYGNYKEGYVHFLIINIFIIIFFIKVDYR